MKIRYYFSMAIAALVMTNCSQEDELQEIQENSVHTITATIEGGSRSAVTDGGAFSWTSGDAISVWNGNSKDTYSYSGDGNKFNGSSSNISGYAVYPDGSHSNLSGSGLPTVNLKASYSYGSTNAIMLAKVQGNNKNLSFNHLGGLMRFTIKDIPANATSFTFTANSGITGNFNVTTEAGENVIKAAAASNNNKTVTITFTGSQTERTFYVPLPVGTYNGFTITVGSSTYTSQATNTINRRTLLLMPTFTCSGSHLIKGNNAVSLENTKQEMNVSGNESLLIETPNSSNSDAELTLNYTPETNSTLNLSDGISGNSTYSKAKVEVNVSGNNAVKELNIDAPTLTVTLASGTYESVTAKTATQTLIIKKGVTVKNLKVIGGQVITEKGSNVVTLEEPNLRVLTFEGNNWSDLIDNPQYGGSLLYPDYNSGGYEVDYSWSDIGNTNLYHKANSWGYASGGHAISNYWRSGYTDDDRNEHVTYYYGEDYVEENAGNDAALGWFSVQLMIPIPPHSGNNFAVHFGYVDFYSMSQEYQELSFDDGEARVIDHMYVTNTNYTLNQLMYGVGSEAGNTFGGSYKGPSENSWYKIIAKGYDSNDNETGKVEFYLMKNGSPVLDWQKWDLSKLGKVVRVEFNMKGSDDMGGQYGLTIPAYFAYDDVAVQFEE